MAKVRVICGTDLEGTPFVIVGDIMGFPADNFIEKNAAKPDNADEARPYAESITRSINSCCRDVGVIALMLGFLPFPILKEGHVDLAIADCAKEVTFDGDVEVDGWEETDGYIKETFACADDCKPTEL